MKAWVGWGSGLKFKRRDSVSLSSALKSGKVSKSRSVVFLRFLNYECGWKFDDRRMVIRRVNWCHQFVAGKHVSLSMFIDAHLFVPRKHRSAGHKHWNTVQLLHLMHFYSGWFAPNICTLHISVHIYAPICTYANICTYMCTSVHICTCTIVHSAMVDNDICQSSKGKHAPVAQPWLAVSFVFALF